MKKTSLILVIFLSLSCSKNENEAEVQTKDCNCDRIVEIVTYNVVGNAQSPALKYYSNYTTINDCTQIQRSKTSNTTNFSLIPKKGQCK